MATVSIQYYKFDKLNPSNEYLLGSEYTKNIDEILVPLNEKHSPFFITKAFTGQVCKRWKVEFVLGISKNVWGIWLTEKNVQQDIYLSQTMQKRKIRHAGGIVKKGTIVIVEYGHIYLTLNFRAGLSDSSLYPCQHQSGEMHKRRPAIVVRADKRGVTVIPITSQTPSSDLHNKAIFQLELDSIRYISEFESDKTSYALCEMLQTVSPSRILPPNAKDLKSKALQFRRDESYKRKLSKNDFYALEAGLLTAIGFGSLREKKISLMAELNTVNTEIKEQKNQNGTLQKELTELKAKLEDMQKRDDIFKQLYLPFAKEKSMVGIESEIAEYMQLDKT
ncbi:type II toxin-antitoxin system PemK/MazF family toxin [Providencia rettgeri]|uniref:type II toxin-antitoxin system PemK/MazF family toxin n=1 Tax=Providencia rettgeri TaxID=587 RepID=UPI0023AAD1A4|nr:type II toxin-antitoxin system PemK/MazF family toxin [Providencia rettgeri]ELR5150534.1 type II toxin-antitoxin system PemK/MazF family toxin [Providencia rettgeri]